MAVTDQGETIWKAIRAALIAHTGVQSLLGAGYTSRIARRALPGDALPCILCGSLESVDRGTDDSDAGTVRVELHVWSHANDIASGVARGAALKEAVKSALHWADIGIRCTVEAIRGPLPDPDQNLHHFVVVVEAISTHEAI